MRYKMIHFMRRGDKPFLDSFLRIIVVKSKSVIHRITLFKQGRRSHSPRPWRACFGGASGHLLQQTYDRCFDLSWRCVRREFETFKKFKNAVGSIYFQRRGLQPLWDFVDHGVKFSKPLFVNRLQMGAVVDFENLMHANKILLHRCQFVPAWFWKENNFTSIRRIDNATHGKTVGSTRQEFIPKRGFAVIADVEKNRLLALRQLMGFRSS